jgi:phosphohistidine phosphatase
MNLFLLRHGNAEDRNALSPDDFSRALVEKGHQQARNAARILSSATMSPDIVLCSPFVRARETAESFTQAANMPGPVIQSWLACGMNPETALSELQGFLDFKSVMIVGHEPDFSEFAQYLLGCSADSIEIRKGSIACFEVFPPSRKATLRFLIPFKLAKHME